MIAHRGVSGLEAQNSAAAFVAAGNRSYFGIETDIHATADGKYIIIHDDNTKALTGEEYIVEQTDFDVLRALRIFDKDGTHDRGDLMLPTLHEYITICKRYGKTPILELKNPMSEKCIYDIVEEIKQIGYLEQTVFISFCFENLVCVKKLSPGQRAQLLIGSIPDLDALVARLKEYEMGVDSYFEAINAENIKIFHDNGIEVNIWTVDSAEIAQKYIDMGVDYITTDILE